MTSPKKVVLPPGALQVSNTIIPGSASTAFAANIELVSWTVTSPDSNKSVLRIFPSSITKASSNQGDEEAIIPSSRSEERRVGKESRSRRSPYHEKKKIRIVKEEV